MGIHMYPPSWTSPSHLTSHPTYLSCHTVPVSAPSHIANSHSIQLLSCVRLCNPMDCSTPGFPIHHQLQEPTQTHVQPVDDTIQPFYPLSSPSLPAFNLSHNQGLFQWVSSSHQVTKVLEFQLQHQSFQWIFRTNFPMAIYFTYGTTASFYTRLWEFSSLFSIETSIFICIMIFAKFTFLFFKSLKNIQVKYRVDQLCKCIGFLIFLN